MTACHTYGSGQFGKHVERCHYRNGFCITLKVTSDTACLDLCCGYHDKYHDCPSGFGVKIRGRAPDTKKTYKIGYYTGGKQGSDKRNVFLEFLAHVSYNKIIRQFNKPFGYSLTLADFFDLEISGQKDAKSGDQQHYDPTDYHGLVYFNLLAQQWHFKW